MGSQVVVNQDYSFLRFSFSIDREISFYPFLVMEANEYFDFATPVVLDHKTTSSLSAESYLYNYPWLDSGSDKRALAGVLDDSSLADTKYFIDLRLNPKTSSYPSRMKFKFFLITSTSFQKNRFTESPRVSNILEVEAFLNCPENCSACVSSAEQTLMTCQACAEGFTLESGECV